MCLNENQKYEELNEIRKANKESKVDFNKETKWLKKTRTEMKTECQIKLTGKLHQQNKRNGRETFLVL